MLGDDWKQDVYGKWISLALPVGMAAGAIVSGWASDRLFDGRRSKVIVMSMTMAALTTFAMYRLAGHSWAGVPLLFLAGLFAYGPQAAFWALCPDLLGRRHAGTATGVMNSFAYLFAGLGEPLIGWIIESNDGDTSLAFLVVATSCAASATLALFVRR
jgi:OPA family glycerol-3-phosphate transporter-like MFS transporter